MVQSQVYDLFVSYSHADSDLVGDLAFDLSQEKVRLWWDEWEMRPGDVLRDRVNAGLESSAAYLVVISEHSLSSRWVQHELTVAFIRHIEEANVRVIPCLAGKVDYADLPIDLRARFALDLRTREGVEAAVRSLVDLIKPERRLRRELLRKLRNPEVARVEKPELLSAAVRGSDQVIQKAALAGLARVGGGDAVLAATERSLDTWGMGAIGQAIKTLGKLPEHGSMLALSATVMFDTRFISERLEALAACAQSVEDEATYDRIVSASDVCGPTSTLPLWMNTVLDELLESTNLDVLNGATLSRHRGRREIPTSKPLPDPAIRHLREYFDNRLPGLWELLDRHSGHGL